MIKDTIVAQSGDDTFAIILFRPALSGSNAPAQNVKTQ